jgi:hypothetical protein
VAVSRRRPSFGSRAPADPRRSQVSSGCWAHTPSAGGRLNLKSRGGCGSVGRTGLSRSRAYLGAGASSGTAAGLPGALTSAAATTNGARIHTGDYAHAIHYVHGSATGTAVSGLFPLCLVAGACPSRSLERPPGPSAAANPPDSRRIRTRA